MKTKLLLLLVLAAVLTGCGGAAEPTAEVLPTVVLDSGAVQNGTAVPLSNSGGVVASGVVIPAQQVQLSAETGGTILKINAEVGAAVNQNEMLITFSGKTQQEAVVASARLELLNSQQALDTLKEDAEVARAQAQLRLANAQDAYNEAKKQRGWKEYRIGDDTQIEAARADLIVAKDWLKRKQDTYGGWADSPEDNLNKAAALSELSNAQKAVDRAQANLNYLMNKPDEFEVAIADANLEVARTELDAAQRAYDSLADGPDPDALAQAQTRVSQAQAQLEAAETTLKNLEFRAPFSGTLSKLYYESGEWVQPGQPVLILADLQHFNVETTDLSERDVAGVTLGQPVTVQIEALNQSVRGSVIQLDPLADTLGGDVVYRSVVSLQEIPEGLRAGMSAEVTFLTE